MGASNSPSPHRLGGLPSDQAALLRGDGYKVTWINLTVADERLGINVPQSHDALHDAKTTLAVLEAL